MKQHLIHLQPIIADPNVPEDMGMADSAQEKRPLDDSNQRSSKSAKVQSYPTKHVSEAGESSERVKLPRLEGGQSTVSATASGSSTGLQSSPMHAANIRMVSEYGGVNVYIDDGEDGGDLSAYADDLASGFDFPLDEEYENFTNEKAGPPNVDDETLEQLDQEAALEEINRLRSMSVIENYFEVDGSETILDTRQVHDWRFRNDCWRRRCRLVAREFRAGAQSTEETFSPTSSKYVVNIFLTLALVYGLSILVVDIKDAFLCVPQRDLVII